MRTPMAKKPQQILFSKNRYGTKVKVEHWEYHVQTEKKDNYIYRDRLSNHISTYNRWGNDEHGTGMTETRYMHAQVFTKTDPVYSFKPLVNFTSYPCTEDDTIPVPHFYWNGNRCHELQLLMDTSCNIRKRWVMVYHTITCLPANTNLLGNLLSTPGRNKLMKSANLAQLPPDFGVMDYMSTQQDDYRNPFPSVTKPLTMASPPPLLNRIIRSDLTHNHGTAPPRGNYQCLDTHTPIGHIRQLRLFRYQSYDPATCLQNFPNLQTSLDNNKTDEI